MKKRKDTKVYQQTVEKYCSARRVIETYNEQIERNNSEIEKAKNVLNTLPKELAEGEIKEWYNCYCNIRKTVIGTAKNLIVYHQEDFETCGAILKYDYEENLDELYSNNKKY